MNTKQKKPKQKFNLSYMTVTTTPIFMVGFQQKNYYVVAAASLLLAFFVIGGIWQSAKTAKR